MYSLFENILAPLEAGHLWWSSGDLSALPLTGLAAGKPGNEVWIQFVVIAAIVGFSILKAIVRGISGAKTMAEQKPRQNEEKHQRPVSLTGGRGKYVPARGDYKTIEQLRAEKITQIRAAFGIPEPPPIMAEKVESEPVPVQRLVRRAEVKRPKPVPQQNMTAAETPSASHISHAKQPVKSGKQTSETGNILIHLNSPQDLRSAILYQEILGPPVSMR
ncbi:MAG: hypothetical protein WC496_02045 [Phycisphaerae bacterium]|jgi:hypothetical protein